MRHLAWWLILILLAPGAFAEDDIAVARRHFEAGTRAFNLGEFKSAAEEYRAAYKLKPDPGLLYNIAQSYRLDRNIDQALFFYRSYLRNATTPANRDEVNSRIKVLEEQLKQQQSPPNDVVKPVEAAAPPPIHPDVKPEVKPAPPSDEIVASAAPVSKPVYKKWWLWTAVGAVVIVGVGLGVGLGLGLQPSAPSSALGNHPVF